jgi:hypothetical protein
MTHPRKPGEVGMSELSELEMRILSELEEAGEEDIVTIIATVTSATGDIGEVEEIQRTLESLVKGDLIRMSMERDVSGRLADLSKDASLRAIAELGSTLRFDSEKKYWADMRHSGPPFGDAFPYIVNTEPGKKKGFEILDARGYQWWRPKK